MKDSTKAKGIFYFSKEAYFSQCRYLESINNYPPEYLRDLFSLRDNIKNLRSVNKLQVLKPNTTRYGNNTVKYLAANTWNKISDTLRSLTTLSAFRKAVRELSF